MNCPNLQKSIGWCDGTPVYPGIRRRLYYIAATQIVAWPTRERLENGAFASEYVGSFVLAADATWKYIDVIVNNSGLTSEPQNEQPSQLQLNKLVAVHPGTGKQATAASNYINNCNNVYLIQDMEGNWRVLGSQLYQSKSTFNQDLGQGASGTASSTINVEAADATAAPFYSGQIVTEDGVIMANGEYVMESPEAPVIAQASAGANITITAEDGTAIKYKLGNAAWQTYSAAITVTSADAGKVLLAKAVKDGIDSEIVAHVVL